MPVVGVNNEPLLVRAIFGHDGTNYRVVKVDTDGNLVAAVKASQTIAVTQATAANLKALVDINTGQTIAVTQGTAANLLATVNLATDQNVQARGYGYDGSSWITQGVPLNYRDRLIPTASNTNLSAGNNTVSLSAVPSNFLHILTNISFQYVGTVTSVGLFIYINSTNQLFSVGSGVSSATRYDKQGMWILKAGDTLDLLVTGATAGDDAYLHAAGYSVALS